MAPEPEPFAQLTAEEVLGRLRGLANPANAEGMARYGISPVGTLGVAMPGVQRIAKEAGRSHELALALWDSGVHEARILAALVDDPRLVTPEQMESWAAGFDSWDIVDQVCIKLFRRTPFAFEKAEQWAGREETFVKRAGFALMATLGVHEKRAPDEAFERFLGLIEREASDERNFVEKAVNWALRQIGKRDERMNGLAVEAARRIAAQGSKAARWIASDALRELTSEKVRQRLG